MNQIQAPSQFRIFRMKDAKFAETNEIFFFQIPILVIIYFVHGFQVFYLNNRPKLSKKKSEKMRNVL